MPVHPSGAGGHFEVFVRAHFGISFRIDFGVVFCGSKCAFMGGMLERRRIMAADMLRNYGPFTKTTKIALLLEADHKSANSLGCALLWSRPNGKHSFDAARLCDGYLQTKSSANWIL